ncbi:MAG: MFS transporter [Pseudomonadales bacterium]|jgi:MFS family permease|tara:strand:- start:3754 stop:5097 length:1344 start_codon:yes stop_codon:yes gene_type:complete
MSNETQKTVSSGSGPTSRADTTLYKAGMFDSLKIRDFRFLWVSSLCATFAMQMQMVARGWLIYDMTSSPLALTWVMLSFMLPSFLFSLAGGVIADRLKKKPVMILSQLLNACATILLAYFIYTGNIEFWDFIYFGLFNGTILAFSMPARSAITPEIVGPDNMVNAMALQSATFNLARVMGPAIAGGMIAFFAAGDKTSTEGVGIVFFVIAGLYFLSVVCTSMLNYKGEPIARKKASPLEDIREGFRYMLDEKLIMGLLIMGFVPFTFGFSASFLLPAFNHDIINGGPGDLGLLMTAMGGGALCGSLLLAKLGDFPKKGRVMFYCAFLWAISLALFAFSNSLHTAMAMGILTGLFSAIFGALNMSIIQLAIKPEIRGRVMSMMMMTHGLMPLGVIPISALAEYIGIDIALMVSAAMLVVSMLLLGYFFPDLRNIDRGHGDNALVAKRS